MDEYYYHDWRPVVDEDERRRVVGGRNERLAPSPPRDQNISLERCSKCELYYAEGLGMFRAGLGDYNIRSGPCGFHRPVGSGIRQ